MNEDQFGVALALLGQTEKKEDLKILYDDLAISDGLSIDGFMLALNRQVTSMFMLSNIYILEKAFYPLEKEKFIHLLIYFGLLFHRLRQKGHEEESLKRILEAFNALYDGTCLNDDQKDFSGQRYIYANDFRLLLTTTGNITNFLTIVSPWMVFSS